MVDVPLPILIGDVAVTVDCAGDTGPGLTTTLAVCVRRSVPFTLAVTVLVPGAVELSVPVAWPFTWVGAPGCVSVLPVVGVAASVTVAPLTGLPPASRTVTGIVLEPEPAVIVAGAAPTHDCDAPAPPPPGLPAGTPSRPGDRARPRARRDRRRRRRHR